MIDPVSELLERRSATPWRWRAAVILALALHAAVGALALFSPSPGRRALTLPRVQVRITSVPALQAAAPAPASQPAAAKPAPARPQPISKRPEVPVNPPARKTVSRSARPKPTSVPDTASGATGLGGKGSDATGSGTQVASPAGGIGLGGRSGGTDEAFPYAYYLNRVLATIEGNWFRPPVAPEVRCRVLCRIDRAGGLVEVGIEEPSGFPAFDRAALRSVYASAPFPPLPQGYGGATLTLHLEYGSK